MTSTYDKAAAAAELEAFKQAPLIDLAVAMGWQVTEKGNNSAKIQKGSMKIAVFKGSSAWMWKCFNGEGPAGRTSGTVVDLAIDETGSIGKARQLLRSLTGTSAPTSAQTSTTPAPASTPAPVSSSTSPNSAFSGKTYKTPAQVLSEFKTGAKVWHPGDPLPPFMSERGVRDLPEIFHGKFAVTQCRRRDARFLFATFDDDGKAIHAGWEDRNLPRKPGAKSYRRYGTDCRQGFWHVAGDVGAPVVVVEGPLEAISFDILRKEFGQDTGEQVGYLALRSGAEDAAIKYLIRKISAGTMTVVIATGQDAAGMTYAAKLMSGLRQAEKDGLVPKGVLVRYLAPPETHSDWNEALQAYRAREARSESKSSGGPSPRPEPRPAPRRPAPSDTAPCMA